MQASSPANTVSAFRIKGIGGERNSDVHIWRDAVITDPALDGETKLLLLVLPRVMDADGSNCRPGQAWIMAATGRSESWCDKHCAKAVAAGYLGKVPGTGVRGKAAEFCATLPWRRVYVTGRVQEGATPVEWMTNGNIKLNTDAFGAAKLAAKATLEDRRDGKIARTHVRAIAGKPVRETPIARTGGADSPYVEAEKPVPTYGPPRKETSEVPPRKETSEKDDSLRSSSEGDDKSSPSMNLPRTNGHRSCTADDADGWLNDHGHDWMTTEEFWKARDATMTGASVAEVAAAILADRETHPKCPQCSEHIRRTTAGTFYAHGPRSFPCPGSGRTPAQARPR
jgi:hypothetical protein